MPIYLIVGIIVVALLLCASIAMSIYLFRYAIVSKKKTHQEIESSDFETSDRIRSYYQEKRQWFQSKDYETIKIQSYDGLTLQGYLLCANDEPGQSLVFLMHGYDTDAFAMSEFAQFYLYEGFDVFMPDARGHGQSEGKYIGMGWLDRLDILKWLDVLMARYSHDSHVVLHGVSMGAAAVLMSAGEELPFQVKAVIADCAFTSAKEEFRNRLKKMFHLPAFPVLYLGGIVCKAIAGYSFEEASAIAQVKRAEVPILIIHGEKDQFIPVAMAKKLYDAATPVRKALWLVAKAGHARSYYHDPLGYQKHIRSIMHLFQDQPNCDEPKISMLMDFEKIAD